MKIINVKFNKLKVGGFNAQHGSVTLDISFNDGMDKQLSRTTVIDNPKELAHSIINEIYNMEKRIHYEFNDDDVLESHVNIVIQDEDAVLENITNFLAKISEKVRTVLTSKLADGYINKIKELNTMSLEF